MNIDFRMDQTERTGYPTPLQAGVCKCCVCKENIYTGEDYFDYFGDIVCEECELTYRYKHFKRTASNDV